MPTASLSCPAWAQAIAQPAQEFSLTPLPVVGRLPEGLRGTLYRNGPGRLERGGERVGHWFDGDGAVLAVHFADQGASAVYRYVQTAGYQQEAAAESFLFPNYGMTAPGPFWNNWFRKVKNAANTSVLALPDKLLALWEGGNPHSLDLHTLETWGTENLEKLEEGEPFSAHPKVAPDTGEIFNFGIVAGPQASLKLYKSNSSGQIIKTSSVQLEGLPLVHDFILAGPYLVFCIPPVRVNLLSAAVGLSSFSDAMEWKPQLGTHILVIDRDLNLVSRAEADPWYQWHFANGYRDADELVIEVARFPNFQTNQNVKEVATGTIQTPARATLWQMRLAPQTGAVKEAAEVLDRSCEFPVVPQHQTGQPWRYSYLSMHRDEADVGQELFGAIARYDRSSGALSVADMGKNCYPSEPIFVPAAPHSEQGWVLTVVYDGDTDTSEVRVYESDRLEDDPLCRLELPSVIPHSFHGTWKHQR
ncbi:MAG: carotenoid oxygenase family protein [Cyanophyceae cyanobacterium]